MTWVPPSDLRRGWARRSLRAALAAGLIAGSATTDVAAAADAPQARAASAAPEWCGTPRRTDDKRHAAFPGLPTVKLVYAYPAGRPNRINHFAPILQANAVALSRYMAEQSALRKTIRFDLGTSCGPQYADIQVIRLKKRAWAYRDEDGAPTVEEGTRLQRELRHATRDQRRGKKFLVYADGLNHVAPGELDVTGMTDELPEDDRRTPANAANRGGHLAVVFGPDRGTPAKSSDGFEQRMFLHELLHTLGAVQEGAPHATSAGHCTDGSDVMCYRDRSARSALYTDRACKPSAGAIAERLDCDGDDYFNPAPAPGSYLATHWNVYDSVFLASCSDARVSAACTPTGRAAAAPDAQTGPGSSAPLVPAGGGQAVGAATVQLDVGPAEVVVHASSTPLWAPAVDQRIETCLAVAGGAQSSPWRDCVTEDVEETPFRAPERSVTLARPPVEGTVATVEIRLLNGPDGGGMSGNASTSVPVPPAT